MLLSSALPAIDIAVKVWWGGGGGGIHLHASESWAFFKWFVCKIVATSQGTTAGCFCVAVFGKSVCSWHPLSKSNVCYIAHNQNWQNMNSYWEVFLQWVPNLKTVVYRLLKRVDAGEKSKACTHSPRLFFFFLFFIEFGNQQSQHRTDEILWLCDKKELRDAPRADLGPTLRVFDPTVGGNWLGRSSFPPPPPPPPSKNISLSWTINEENKKGALLWNPLSHLSVMFTTWSPTPRLCHRSCFPKVNSNARLTQGFKVDSIATKAKLTPTSHHHYACIHKGSQVLHVMWDIWHSPYY